MTRENVVQISRDPFARTALVRRVNERGVDGDVASSGCRNCDNFRLYHRTRGMANVQLRRETRLFQYGTQRDDRGGTSWHRGLFCSKSCHDSYHG